MSANKQFHISSSPHVREQRSVPQVMRDVVIALIPALIASVYFFGMRSLILTGAAVLTAVVTEHVIAVNLMKQRSPIHDLSAVITGFLVAFNVPVGIPVWMVVVGTFFAIAIAKWTFGGLGANFINPALAGRAFLLANYPAAMTGSGFNSEAAMGKLPENLSGIPTEILETDPNLLQSVGDSTAQLTAQIDAITSATPLENAKAMLEVGGESAGLDILQTLSEGLGNLFMGNVGGCIGETSALALLLGGIYMLYRGIINFTIPVFFIGTVFVLYLISTSISHSVFVFSSEPFTMATYQILSGGLFLGAFFMATDMVTSPITFKGQMIFAISCGLLTFVIRQYGGYPEGVSYSILLMNLLVPLIDRYIKPKVYGTKGAKA